MKKTTTWDIKEPFLMKMVLMICSIMRKVLVTTRLKKNKKKQKQNNNNTGRPRRQIVSQSDGSISIPSLFRIRFSFLSFFFSFSFSLSSFPSFRFHSYLIVTFFYSSTTLMLETRQGRFFNGALSDESA